MKAKSDFGVSSTTNWKTSPLAKPLISYSELKYVGIDHIDIEVEDQNTEGYILTMGLLNSSSQGSYINKAFPHNTIANHKVMADSIMVIMVDGNHSSSPVTYFDTVAIHIVEHEEQLVLDTMSLLHSIILGMPWHKDHNACIDYEKNTLTFNSKSCYQHCSHYGKTVPLYSCHQKPQIQKPLTPTTLHITDTETTDQGSNTTESPRSTPHIASKGSLN